MITFKFIKLAGYGQLQEVETADSIVPLETAEELSGFCDRAKGSQYIGFDTEFVSENRYRPELCLLQVATDSELVIIDTLKIKDISPFWQMLTSGDHITIAHAAREEFLFCFRDIQQRPKNLVDVQLAAGFVGFDYPASYSNIVSAILGEFVSKGETRTDWAKRPLSDRQLKYAAGDVEHLTPLCEVVCGQLEKSGRMEWYREEVNKWMDDLERTESEPQWHRISGASRLNRRSLGILNELWLLRDRTAKDKNKSPRRIIPDDLMIELSKRGSAKPSSFKSIRGFDSRVARWLTDDIGAAISKANELSDNQLPDKMQRSKSINLGLVGQFLSTILGVVCQQKKISASLVGSAQEIRNYAAWRMGQLPKKPAPALASGWRAEVIGEAVDLAINGKLALRVGDAKSDNPLTIEEL